MASTALAIAILALIGTIYMGCKFRNLTLTLIALKQAPLASPLTPTNNPWQFMWHTSTTKPPTMPMVTCTSDYISNPIFYVTLIATLVATGAILYRIIKNYCRCRTTVCLELTNGQQSVQIPLLNLPLGHTFWDVYMGSPRQMDNITIKFRKGTFVIMMDWHEAKPISDTTKSTFEIPPLIKVTPWQAYRIWQITHQKFYSTCTLNTVG
jgi:hypothetical protein